MKRESREKAETFVGMEVDDAISVWNDLELALMGENGFGGDVAEIYAYRLVGGFKSPRVDVDAILAGKNMTTLLRRFVKLHRGISIAIEERSDGFRAIDVDEEEFPPFDWRVHLRVYRKETPTTPVPDSLVHELREALDVVAKNGRSAVSIVDELLARRAEDRLLAKERLPAEIDDLPPDAPTGLYLDRPFDVDDLAWIGMAWDAYCPGARSIRPSQLMLVFQAIQRDERVTNEFLRVMNEIVLPLCRRLLFRDRPGAIVGAARE